MADYEQIGRTIELNHQNISEMDDEKREVEKMHNEYLQGIACREIEDAGKQLDISVSELETLRNKNMNDEEKYNALKKRMLELEEEQKRKERNVEKLKDNVEDKKEEKKKWKVKNKQSEHGLSTMEWIEKGMNEDEKWKMRRHIQKAMGSKGEERRNQSRYKGKR